MITKPGITSGEIITLLGKVQAPLILRKRAKMPERY